MFDYTLPLKGDAIVPGTGFFKVVQRNLHRLRSQRLLLRPGRCAGPGLNQNRLWVGGGYAGSPKLLEPAGFGLLWQHRPKADFVRLVVTWYVHNFDFRRESVRGRECHRQRHRDIPGGVVTSAKEET